jgi:hypothetical protein
MGAIAESIVAYAQPLIDQTDGSVEQIEKAFALSTFCYNLALLPDDMQEQQIRDLQPSVEMDDQEFAEFRSSVIDPMIRRHQEMFPRMNRQGSTGVPKIGPSSWSQPKATTHEKYPGTDRYAPCPCNSGRKYKFCCWASGR